VPGAADLFGREAGGWMHWQGTVSSQLACLAPSGRSLVPFWCTFHAQMMTWCGTTDGRPHNCMLLARFACFRGSVCWRGSGSGIF
jgi:hypothetical protein